MLIVGANRGIGLGLVDVHLDAGWQVHATTRDGSAPRNHPRLTAHRYEVRNEVELDRLVTGLPVIDRIIHNAGVMRVPRPEMMEVNAVAPIRTVERLLETGRIGSAGTVALMTSQMGARRGRSGSLGGYGDSKAALNDAFRERVAAWGAAGVIAVVIHPGWVRTDMGGSGASLSVEESAEGIIEVMDRLTGEDHGKFLTWDGRIHPW